MPAVDQNPYEGLEFIVEGPEGAFRAVKEVVFTAAEAAQDPDHPLRGMLEFGFDSVSIDGEIAHGNVEILAAAEAPFRLPDAAFMRSDANPDQPPVSLELSVQSGGERVVDVIVRTDSGISSENTLGGDLVTEEAWRWLESVRDGVKGVIESRHLGED